jgi:hypothetical protein
MNTPPLRRLRNWLARKGLSLQRHIYSSSIWSVGQSDLKPEESSEHGGTPGCDAWNIHLVLLELRQSRGFGFAHFNDG